MKIHCWTIGKSNEPYVAEGIDLFTKRIKHYYPIEWTILPAPKQTATLSEADRKKKEGYMILD